MSRNYGTLRGRRSGGAAWQWIAIGFVVGFGCAAVVGLALVIGAASGTFGEDAAGLLVAGRPSQTPYVITATPVPATPTLPPTEVLVSPTPQPTIGQVEALAPTPTPTTDPALIQVEPSATPTDAPTEAAAQPGAQVAGGGGALSAIPDALIGQLTELRLVDGGTFQIGTTAQEVAAAVNECVDVYEGNCLLAYGEDSSPAHNVTIDPYQMEVTEVTYAQYIAFLNWMGPNSHRNGCDGQICAATRAEDENSNIIFDSANYRVNPFIANHPVTGITWYGARKYCATLNRRLPTEAEWERAARGPQNFLYPWGSTFDTTLANTSRPRVDAALDGAEPVGTYPLGASAYGMLDMAGNVAEWVSDWYSPTFYTQQAQSAAAIINPTGPVAGTEKVVRGGSWDAVPFFARSVHRQSFDPASQALWIGFRCAADLDTTAPAVQGVNPVATLPPASGSEEDTTSNSQPTLAPPPATPTGSGPLPTLPPG
ncbi:MAG: SUMF1/EgtB/PvdO family nonheme iron enzyme [Chloroflexi bacterium]|nr:SUMF1/EgtB/PvdO family nonheme iron enzyme [Chloroflexota bacterium]